MIDFDVNVLLHADFTIKASMLMRQGKFQDGQKLCEQTMTDLVRRKDEGLHNKAESQIDDALEWRAMFKNKQLAEPMPVESGFD